MWKHMSRIMVGVGLIGLAVYATALISHLRFIEKPSKVTESPPSDIPPITGTLADRAVQRAKGLLTRNANDPSGYIHLAEAYMRKARETGDSGFFEKAEAAVHHVLTKHPEDYGARRVQTWIALGRHDFSRALLLAKQLQKERPEDYWVYGMLGDAYTELGEYSKAVEALQQMMDRRPGLPAYSRAAYMRSLHGDLDGATKLMGMAVRSGGRRDPEPLAWTLVQYGNLFFHQGRLDEAEAAYQQAVEVFPSYSMALGGMAQVRAGQNRYAEAIDLLEEAIAVVPAPDLIGYLGDLYELTGQEEQADRQYRLVEFIEQVNGLNKILYSRQFVLFYADHQRNLDKALQLAKAERNRRNDIYTNDALAWVYYHLGRLSEARQAMDLALRLGTRDASFLYHAGMIAKDVGDHPRAKRHLTEALTMNPYFSPRGAIKAKQALKELTLSVKAHEEDHEFQKGDTRA